MQLFQCFTHEWEIPNLSCNEKSACFPFWVLFLKEDFFPWTRQFCLVLPLLFDCFFSFCPSPLCSSNCFQYRSNCPFFSHLTIIFQPAQTENLYSHFSLFLYKHSTRWRPGTVILIWHNINKHILMCLKKFPMYFYCRRYPLLIFYRQSTNGNPISGVSTSKGRGCAVTRVAVQCAMLGAVVHIFYIVTFSESSSESFVWLPRLFLCFLHELHALHELSWVILSWIDHSSNLKQLFWPCALGWE